MNRRVGVGLALFALSPLLVAPSAIAQSPDRGQGGSPPTRAQIEQEYETKAEKVKEKKADRVDQADRDAAAARALQEGALNPLMVGMDAAAAAAPGEAPRYFSHANYANSPLPSVTPADATLVGNPLIDRAYATDNAANVFVVVPTPLPDGMLQSFQTWNQAGAGGSFQPSAGLSFHAYVLRPAGPANHYTVVFDSGQLTVPALSTAGVSEVATFPVANLAVQAGDVLAFYGQGVPMDIGAGADIVSFPADQAPLQGSTIVPGAGAFPSLGQQRTYSFAAGVVDAGQATVAGGIRKFVDELPGLGAGAANNLGQYIPVAVPDTTTYPGADYYEIGLVQYEEQMHSDLPPTLLRGYVQLSTEVVPGAQAPLSNANRDGTSTPIPGFTGVDGPHYLGPLISATKDRPVRILFRNLLPTGDEGNLFIPVDTTVMGSGMGPNMPLGPTGEMMEEMDPQRPMCGALPKDKDCFAENRATLHLHGGVTPWISDGTPHQWITPAGEDTSYPEGVSVENVPDMPDPGPGAQTFFYTNAQSARLMFYHDHAWGITRLNVYAGEAAPYLITDDTEKALLDSGVIPGAESTIPLVVQDKTFVPDPEQVAMQDETWDYARWGSEGDLWLPHVYSPAQNPGDSSGVNQYGRWAYGPWFWPPTNAAKHQPVPNPYFDPTCDPDLTWCEPALMPATPYNSMGMEAFNDTPVVNGTVYPTTTVEPKSYRLRILNGASDRFFNFSLYQADATGTEVALNPAEVAAALDDPAVFPTPVAGTEGPSWIQFGTEGGFLPSPVVVPPQPITWVTDPTVFNAGNVDKHSLLLAPAERADVVVDFSAYAGKTLILYNDAPAAFPARDPRYDYYTGNADLTDTGGTPSTRPGYGPNTRTVMQIKVADAAPAPAFDVTALQNAFKPTDQGGQGVFQNGSRPIIVGQGAYNSAYGTSFQNNGPNAGLVQIFNTSFSFKTLANGAAGPSMTMPLQPKQIQDEQGEAFDPEYGRMSGFLGVETPNAQAGLQNMILYPYTYPPTEIIDGIERDEMTMPDGVTPLPEGVEATPIVSADDGTQIWKFTHNGVDTHPIHFHLYDVQLINRVGWDGIIRKPDLTELGWKDTVRISPLEDTIVAVRPIVPAAPFDLPNSVRLLNPMLPDGAVLNSSTQAELLGKPITAFAPNGEPIDIVNHEVNFGWEYVLHCHILSHEEMDMMRTQSVGIRPKAPTGLTVARVGNGPNRRMVLTWLDGSTNETAFAVQRATNGTWTTIATVPSATGPATGGTATYTDPIGNTNQLFQYRVQALNVVGDTWDYADPNLNEIVSGGFPTLTLTSAFVTPAPPAAPSNVVATAARQNNANARVTVTWTDNATGELGYTVQRANDAGFTSGVTTTTLAANATSITQTVPQNTDFWYRVRVDGIGVSSAWVTATPAPIRFP